MKSKNITIVPAYNEEETIEEVVRRSIQHSDVCVVNDASKDQTPKILERLQNEFPNRLFVIHHEKNTHIPGGLQDGMRFAVQNNYNYVVTIDAGLSHDPDKLPEFFNHAECDLLIGRRVEVENVPLYRRFVSFMAAKVMNYCMSDGVFDLLGPKIIDCTSGYRRYSRKAFSIIADAKLESVSFDFHMEALYLTYKNGGSVRELGINYKFSNSSFNSRVLKQAMYYAWKLLKRKFI